MSTRDRYGPWAIVAGASEGVGRAFAGKLAEEGIASLLVARRSGPLEELAAEIQRETGIQCAIAAIDLAAPDAVDRIVAAAGNREIGLFVSNAGSDPNGSRFLDKEVDAWRDLVQRNVMTTMLCCHRFGAAMKARGRGGLLLVNSGACYGGASYMAAYSASKAFVLNFSEALWAELRPHGVDVLTLVLGQTDTPAYRRLLAEKGMPLPIGWASPDAVAELGLARLPHGPVQNWGQEDDVPGMSPVSAAGRRERVVLIDRMSKSTFGDDRP